MKKVNHYISIRLFLFAALCLCHLFTRAQDTPSVEDSSAIKLAARLSISQSEASHIHEAYNYRHAEITQVMKNQAMNPKEQMRQLKQLIAERNRQLNTVLPATKQAEIRTVELASNAQLQARVNAIKQRHAQQINRMPHTQLSTKQVQAP